MNYDKLVNKILRESYVGSGEYFEVDDYGAGKVIKRPIKGKVISLVELKKAQFMKDQESTDAFVRVYEITPSYIVTEKVNVELASKMCWIFTRDYLDISGHESEEDMDDDYVSDFIANKVLNPKSKFEWDWVMGLVKDNEGDPSWKDFNTCAKHLHNLYIKLSNIKWPIKTLDLHSENIGFNSKKQLVVIDF
jgi:hypothetical protein